MIKALGAWDYYPDDKLGRGGYADVFRCRGTDSGGRSVRGAIKILRNPTYANTLQREVETLQALAGCPHTPQLLDFGRNADGLLCVVTELIEGEGLERRIKRDGPLDEPLVAAMIQRLLRTMEFAHGRGYLHKDLKASNLLLADDGIHLLDWGISERLENGQTHSIRSKNQDAVAPECYFGRHGPASDFYQLGLLAWHALAGKLPYHLETEARRDYRVAAHCLERPSLPLTIRGDLLSLLRCWVSKDPRQRPLGYDLQQLLARVSGVHADEAASREFLDISTEGYITAAARAGVPYALLELADRLNENSRHSEARAYIEQAADANYAPAKYKLAELLAGSEEKAATGRVESLLREAAAAGLPKAQYKLSEHLRKLGIHAEESRRLLRLAADNGIAAAQYRLARDLEKSPDDRADSRAWLECAAERGHAKAMERLAGRRGGRR